MFILPKIHTLENFKRALPSFQRQQQTNNRWQVNWNGYDINNICLLNKVHGGVSFSCLYQVLTRIVKTMFWKWSRSSTAYVQNSTKLLCINCKWTYNTVIMMSLINPAQNTVIKGIAHPKMNVFDFHVPSDKQPTGLERHECE